MSVEIFLKFSNDVKGESQAKGHPDEVEVFSFSLGASNPSSVSTGSGSGAGKVDLSSLSIQKQADLASALLFKHCCQGTHLETATLTVREAGGDEPVEYFIMEMKKVFIDSISWGGANGGGKPSESVSMSFEEVKITYWSQDEKGKKKTQMPAGWNVKTNAAAS